MKKAAKKTTKTENSIDIDITAWAPHKTKATEEEVEVKGTLAETYDLVIETQDDLEFAADVLAEIKGKAKELQAMQDSAVHPLSAVVKIIRSWFKPAFDSLVECERVLKDKIDKAHTQMQERQRLALEAAAKASMAGNAKEASKALAHASTQQLDPVKGLTLKQGWSFEVTDLDAIPDEYLVTMVDEKKIQATITARKGKIEIPGIRIFQKTTVGSRAK